MAHPIAGCWGLFNPKLKGHPMAPEILYRLPQVLSRFPVSRSGWYAGVRSGKYPAPVKAGPRMSMWRASEINALIAAVAAK